ncbi:MAG: TonB-dependent receptor plug domain-containing protein [Candidatus Kapaibacteriales bacterium]
MRIFTFIFLAIFLYTLNGKDTLRIQTKAIEVEALRSTKEKVLEIFSKNEFNDSLLVRFGLSNAISSLYFVPGVYIRDYSGIGGVKTVTIRGFSSPNTLIMVDGVRINSAQNGTFDLNLLPSNFLNSYEIIRGGSSSIFGGNASAGVLNFKLLDFQKHFKSSVSYSSFKTIEISAKTRLNLTQKNFSLFGFAYTSSKGNYPFLVNFFGQNLTYKRENGNFENLSAIFSSTFELSQPNITFLLITSKTKRGVPGAVVLNKYESKRTKLDDFFLLSSVQINYPFSSNTLFTFSVNSKLLFEKFYDPDLISIILKKETANFDNKFFSILANFESKIHEIKFNLLAEVSSEELIGDFLQPEVKGKVQRSIYAFSCIVSKEFELPNYVTQIFASYRLDKPNDFKIQHSLAFGAKFLNLLNTLDYGTIISINFRPPSFNEMYYLNYGTTNLKPERSYTLNLDLSTNRIEILQPKISLFYHFTFDKIISIPKSPIQWTAQNLAKVVSYGFEFYMNLSTQKLNALLSYTHQKTIDKTSKSFTYKKQLPYTPLNIFSFSALYSFPLDFSLGINQFLCGERFALPDNSIASRLSPYSLWGITITKSFEYYSLKLNFTFEINNIFDQQYEIYLNYPMPGRSFKFSFNSFL